LPDAKDVLHLDDTNTQYYMCGPKGFMDEQKTKLVELGVSEDNIHWEGFA
jgi:ferredoxin-NADP reductase